MAISPWVPAAVELGSLAFSGIGSWLSSRDQRKYQEDIRRMQEDARKRVADAQKIANQRANYFSIMTKQRVAPDPVNLDLPVIPAYDPGNWTKLMSGLGKGLGYAAKGASAFHTAQTYSEKLAAEAGKQAAQRDAWEAKQNADVTGQFKPYSTYNTKGEDTYTPVDISRSYLDHLGKLTDEKAYEKHKLMDLYFRVCLVAIQTNHLRLLMPPLLWMRIIKLILYIDLMYTKKLS